MTTQPVTRAKQFLWQYWDSLLIFVGFLSLYIATLAPGVLPADSGEFQVVVPLLGVAHPPGFSLYILLGKLFISIIPFGTAAYRLNLFSAFTSALTLVLVNVAVRRLVDTEGKATLATRLPGILAAIVLGVSTTFWSQATTTNIRSLMALLTALVVVAVIGYRQAPTSNRLAFLAMALVLAVVHHLSIAFIAAVLGLAIFFLGDVRKFGRNDWIKIILVGASPLLVLIYLPIRGAMGAYLAPPGLTTISGFLQHVLGLGFGGDFFYFAQWSALPDRLAILFNIFEFQFNTAALLPLGLGLILFFFKDWKLALALTLAFVVHCFIAITYRAPQTVEYLLPAYVILVIVAVAGLAHQILKSPAPTLPVRLSWIVVEASLLIAALFIFFRNLPAYQYLAQDTSTLDHAKSILFFAPDNSVILSDWNYATPMWYLQKIENAETSVDVQYVFPEGLSLAQNWVDRLNANVPNGPVLITDYYPTEFAQLPYAFRTSGLGWLVSAEPEIGSEAGDALLEHHTGGWAQSAAGNPTPGYLTPGSTFSIPVVWQAAPIPADINFFVQLLGPDGLLYGQSDVSHSGAKMVARQMLDDPYVVGVNIDAPPGSYQLVTGVYQPDGTRLAPDFSLLAPVTIHPRSTPPASLHPQLFGLVAGYDYDLSIPDSPRLYLHWRLDGLEHTLMVTDGNGQTLQTVTLPALKGYISTAVDLASDWQTVVVGESAQSNLLKVGRNDFGKSARYVSFGGVVLVGSTTTKEADGSYRVDLDWLADKPLTDDLVVKVDMVGENYAWRDQSDAVPAGGAIPTLKWIPGIVIHDRHRLKPQQATPASFQLAVYDHFTQRNLPILDERLAQLGPTVTLGTVQP